MIINDKFQKIINHYISNISMISEEFTSYMFCQCNTGALLKSNLAGRLGIPEGNGENHGEIH